MKKITAYTWAFIVLILAFFTASMFTLGTTKTTGDAMTVVKNEAVYYELETSHTLKAIYVNIGGIHTAVGEDATITVKTTSSTSEPSKASWSKFGSEMKVGNVYSAQNKSGALYNWVAVATDQSKSTRKISFTSNVTLDLNEIVAINKNNEIVPLKAYVLGTSYTAAEVGATFDNQEAFASFIAEDGTVNLNNGALYNFTQEEAYYMSSVQNVLSGNKKYDATYVLDGNFNYLATVLMTPAVALFGNSVFALRLPAFLATCALIAFAFLLIKELTKREQVALYFSLALMVGGLATTVGRLGAPYAMIACAIVASAYFMYRFFAHGISSKDMLSGALNILFSGLFGAVAIAMDITALLPIAGVLVIFGFGLRRQKLAHTLALEKVTDNAETTVNEEGETVVVNKAAAKENTAYETKTRLSYGFAALSFGMGTVLLLLFSAIVCYSAYVRAVNSEEVNFLAMLWKGIAASARDNGVTSYTAANASVLSWILPYKPAALYTGVVEAGEGAYIGWHVLPNVAVIVASGLAFLAATVKVIIDLALKKNDKKALRMRRAYIVLAGGMVLALGAGLIRGNVSALSGLLFHVLYLGFLPLIATLLPEGETMQEKVLVNVGLCTVIAVFALVFMLALPVSYGYTILASKAKLFNWTSLFSNGFFK